MAVILQFKQQVSQTKSKVPKKRRKATNDKAHLATRSHLWNNKVNVYIMKRMHQYTNSASELLKSKLYRNDEKQPTYLALKCATLLTIQSP